MASAMAKDRLPTAATASLDVDRYTVVGKNLGAAGRQEVKMCRPGLCAGWVQTCHSLCDALTSGSDVLVLLSLLLRELTACVWRMHGR